MNDKLLVRVCEEDLRKVFQPRRTDLESSVVGEEVRYLQVEIEPAGA